jgi:hypothetical protein
MHRNAFTKPVAVGAFLGLAWGAALRAWMVTLALEFGETPSYSWLGTFGLILLPAAMVGAILGGAVHIAHTTDSKRWRWALLAPWLLVIPTAITTENFFTIVLTTGIGGAGIAVALIAMLGGYAQSGFGPRWLRWLAGVVVALLLIAPAVAVAALVLSTPTPSQPFVALLFILLMVLLVAGMGTPAHYARNQTPDIA